MNKTGNRIRQMRELKGLSQDNLAFELEISQSSYARLEKKDERISIKRLMDIAGVLKTSVSELLDEKTQKDINQQNSENSTGYLENIINSDKEHIKTLKEEISFLRKLIEEKV